MRRWTERIKGVHEHEMIRKQYVEKKSIFIDQKIVISFLLILFKVTTRKNL